MCGGGGRAEEEEEEEEEGGGEGGGEGGTAQKVRTPHKDVRKNSSVHLNLPARQHVGTVAHLSLPGLLLQVTFCPEYCIARELYCLLS